ncbi:TetR/AcrR family transcriptional regulator [Rhabdochromatium marinum]|uniref:TetR/AcrR family transcriptional regulator n=1 Tax=Rhabdochromatium marinum TaxID=48729 RepID=UPI0019045E12|nr:TetR/AcrR family transcriptional regulator [Rhabdochromatium marinum]MBK1650339.1 TetR family transcriptional regulator [Rhabdochromatium marinum]
MSDTKPTQQYIRKDDRREMIAEAARALILEKGYAALRTRSVAERVGINISTLHFHVPNKTALVRLVAETSRDAFLALLPPGPDAERPALAQLRAEVRAYHDSLRDRPELAACFGQLTQVATAEPEVAEILDAFTQDWCRRYAEILAIGRSQGVFRATVQPLPAALMITGALASFGPRGPKGLAMFWPVVDEIERSLLVPESRECSDAD